jgi:hypothetical protein
VRGLEQNMVAMIYIKSQRYLGSRGQNYEKTFLIQPQQSSYRDLANVHLELAIA